MENVFIGSATLIADTREKNVLRHATELADITVDVKQITTGDYVVVRKTAIEDRIVAVIERKSLEDFAASIKDGRHSNKEKLIALRAATGCAIVYLVEGPEFPSPTETFGNIPYRHIESAMFHLAVRDTITIFKTKNTVETARWLVRFVKSLSTIEFATDRAGGASDHNETVTTADSDVTTDRADRTDRTDRTDGAPNPATAAPTIDDLLTARYDTAPDDTIRTMWARFPGITFTSADEFATKWSIADIVSGRVGQTAITAHKMNTGKSPNKRVVSGLTRIDRAMETKILASIPGISVKSAGTLIESQGSLAVLCTMTATSLAEVVIGKKKMGPKLADRILTLLCATIPSQR